MTNSPHTLLKDIINLLEQCPVTSDTDWIVKRNDIIVRSRQAIAKLKKGEIPQMANVDSVGRCYAEAFSKSKAEHSPRCNDALHRDAARWAVYQMGFEDGVRLYNGAPTNPVIPTVEENESQPMMFNCFIEGEPPAPYKSWQEWFDEEGSLGILRGLRISTCKGGDKK